jgi:hypothetical protein
MGLALAQVEASQSDQSPCEFCGDGSVAGYQKVWFRDKRGRFESWRCGLRPCSCEAAPAGQRSQSPLQEPEYVRGQRGGTWVKLADLLQYGSPTDESDFVMM